MEIKVNEQIHTVPQNATLLEVLDKLNIQQQGIAVALNQNIVSKQNWQSTVLKTNDNILVITATQGG
jgi:sulfur carrier protein